jgi:hypothetical protein
VRADQVRTKYLQMFVSLKQFMVLMFALMFYCRVDKRIRSYTLHMTHVEGLHIILALDFSVLL